MDFLFSPLAIILVTVLYVAGSWAAWGRTVVMRILGLRILDAEDLRPIDGGTALMRFGALLLAIVPLGAGLAVAARDPRRQGWHDRVAGTVVVAE